MPVARGRALINSKTRELENKPGEGRHNQAERLPSTPPTGTCVSSWRAKNHRQLPVACRVSFGCHSFCLGLKKRGSATLASLGSLGSAGPALKCQLAGFISIAPPGRPFISSRLLGKRQSLRDIDRVFDLAAEARAFLKRGRGLLIPAIFICALLIM